jgi:hypothetical protein
VTATSLLSAIAFLTRWITVHLQCLQCHLTSRMAASNEREVVLSVSIETTATALILVTWTSRIPQMVHVEAQLRQTSNSRYSLSKVKALIYKELPTLKVSSAGAQENSAASLIDFAAFRLWTFAMTTAGHLTVLGRRISAGSGCPANKSRVRLIETVTKTRPVRDAEARFETTASLTLPSQCRRLHSHRRS